MQSVEQLLNATNMIGMMVGANDGGELEVIGFEVGKHRCCISRIHNCSMPTIVNDPEIIILECGDRMNGDCSRGDQAESVKMKI